MPVCTKISWSRAFLVASASKHPSNFLVLTPSGSSLLGRLSADRMKSTAPTCTIRSCVSAPPSVAIAQSAHAASPRTSVMTAVLASPSHCSTARAMARGKSAKRFCFLNLIIVEGFVASPRTMSHAARATSEFPGNIFRHSAAHRAAPRSMAMYAPFPSDSRASARSARSDMSSCCPGAKESGGWTAATAIAITARFRAAYISFASNPRRVRVPGANARSGEGSFSFGANRRSSGLADASNVSAAAVIFLTLSCAMIMGTDSYSGLLVCSWGLARALVCVSCSLRVERRSPAADHTSASMSILTTFRASSHSTASCASFTLTASMASSASAYA